MNQLITYLSGKKTYAVVLVLMAYCAGAKFGLWPLDPAIMAGLGAAAIAALRAGIAKAPKVNQLFQDALDKQVLPYVKPKEEPPKGGTPNA